jgi:hypothetical protein
MVSWEINYETDFFLSDFHIMNNSSISIGEKNMREKVNQKR